MKRFLLMAFVFAMAVTMQAGPAQATPILDQSYEPGTTNGGPISSTAGQSFTAGTTGLLTQVWYVSYFNYPETGTVQVLEGSGLGGTALGGGTATFVTYDGGVAPEGGDYRWKIIDVSSLEVMVTSGQQYSFVVQSSSVNWYVNCSGGYAGGIYLDAGHIYCSPIANPAGEGDMSFRTYVDAEAVDTVQAQWGSIKALYR